MRIEVVLQTPILVAALSEVGPAAITFPAVPPLSGQRYADTVGVFSYPDDYFALSASEELVEEAVVALTSPLLAWEYEQAEAAIDALGELAARGGGGMVLAEPDVEIPEGFSKTAATALRAVCSRDLGHPRVLVTEEPAVLRANPLHPQAIPFPIEEHVQAMGPVRFAKFAERVRWRMRSSE